MCNLTDIEQNINAAFAFLGKLLNHQLQTARLTKTSVPTLQST